MMWYYTFCMANPLLNILQQDSSGFSIPKHDSLAKKRLKDVYKGKDCFAMFKSGISYFIQYS